METRIFTLFFYPSLRNATTLPSSSVLYLLFPICLVLLLISDSPQLSDIAHLSFLNFFHSRWMDFHVRFLSSSTLTKTQRSYFH